MLSGVPGFSHFKTFCGTPFPGNPPVPGLETPSKTFCSCRGLSLSLCVPCSLEIPPPERSRVTCQPQEDRAPPCFLSQSWAVCPERYPEGRCGKHRPRPQSQASLSPLSPDKGLCLSAPRLRVVLFLWGEETVLKEPYGFLSQSVSNVSKFGLFSSSRILWCETRGKAKRTCFVPSALCPLTSVPIHHGSIRQTLSPLSTPGPPGL